MKLSSGNLNSHGYLFAVSSAIASACATVVGKWNLYSISPFLMNAVMFTVACLILLAVALFAKNALISKTISKDGWKWLSLFAASSATSVLAFWSGVQRIDPSLAAFLSRAEVPVAIFLGILFLRERFTRLETIGAILSIGGIVLMRLNLRVEYSSGFWLVLAGALLFGFAEFSSKMALRHFQPFPLTFIRNMLMCGVYWIVFAGVDGSFEGLSKVWYGVIALGILGPLLTRLLYLYGLRQLTLSKAAIISQSQPVFVLLISLLALGYLPTFREMLGGIAISCGALIMILGRSRWMPGNA